MATKKNNLVFYGAVFILILSVIIFVAVPSTSSSWKGNNNVTFGSWNGKPIEYVQDSYFNRQIQTISERMRANGQDINQFAYYQVLQQAFQYAAIRLGMLEELDRAGYKVSENSINKALLKYYQDESGKYSAKLFSETSETVKSSRRVVVSEDMKASRYTEDYFGNANQAYGIKVSTKETELIKSMSSKARAFSYISFSTSAYPQDETAKYGSEHKDLFTKLNLSMITADTEAVAKKVESRLAKKEIAFEDAVTTYSTRSGTDAAGKLSNSYRYSVNALFTDAKDLEKVLALEPSATSSIVKAGAKFAIVRCDAAAQEPDFADAATLSAVSSYMTTNEKGKIEDYFMAKAKEFSELARSAGFDKACKSMSLESKKTTPFSLNYGSVPIMPSIPTSTNSELAAAVKNETFFKTAFSLSAKEVSDPILLGSDVVVLTFDEENATDPSVQEAIPMYYAYYAMSWSEQTMSQYFLTSKKLKDDFTATYLKYFINN